MAKEELIIKLNMLEQRAEEKRQQIEGLDRQLSDMTSLKLSLEKLEQKSDKAEGKEMLASLGRGVFLNTKINDDKVFINVGSRILVRKSFKEAEEIIDKQIMEIEKLRVELIKGIEEINLSLYGLLEEAQKAEKED